MSDLQEPTPNISSLSVMYPEGNFPSHIDIFGKGGFVALNDAIGSSGYNEFINERITQERRKVGMLVYVSSDDTYHRCTTAGTNETNGEWYRQYFNGRYFYGASAPTASDLTIGEKWFNTDVGSEFTYLPTDQNETTFFWVDIDHLGQGESGDIGIDLLANGVSFAADSPTLNITGSSFITVASQGSNGYSISLVDSFVNTSGDTMTGTLTGTEASFTSIAASNAYFGTDSFIIEGSSATFTDMSIMITGGSSLKKHDLTIGTTFDAGNGVNPNVYRIFAEDGVALGGENVNKNNWLGNNVFLSPEGYTLIGFPKNASSSAFVPRSYTDPGGTFPFTLRSLNVSGGIYTDRILEIEPSIISDPNNWVFVAGSISGDAGIYPEGALTAANNFAVASINNPSTPGAVFSIGDLYVGRNQIRENAQLRVHGRALKITGPSELLDDEFVTRKNVMMRRAVQSGSNPIQFSQIWAAQNPNDPNIQDDFLFASLTTNKMGFDFPVDLTFRIAGGAATNGTLSTKWFVKHFVNVKPTSGNVINIYVDRDQVIPFANGNDFCASVSGNDFNTYNIRGNIEYNAVQDGREVWCFLEIAPSPTGPISYG